MSRFQKVIQPKYDIQANLVMPNPINGCKKHHDTIEKFQNWSPDLYDTDYIFGKNGEINPDDNCNGDSNCGKTMSNNSPDISLNDQCKPPPQGADPELRNYYAFNKCPLSCQYINTGIAATSCPTPSQQQQQQTPEEKNIQSICADAVSNCKGNPYCIQHATDYCNQNNQ